MSVNKAKDMTVKYTDVEVARISSTELQENERSKGQKIAYPRYDHPTLGHDQALMMQFPWIRLETYGVPRAGEYYKNDSDRAFVKVPLNESITEVADVTEKLKEIDAYFASEEFASKLLGKKWNKYTYQPIFREATVSQDDDDDDDSKKKQTKSSNLPKFPYLKLKIDTEYGSGAIKTKLYRSEMSDGKRQRTEVTDMASVDDFARIVSFQSNFRPIVRLVKFWAQPLTKKDPTWGATFKIVKAEVEPSAKGNSLYKDYMNSDAFLDSDDEGSGQTTKKVETAPAKKVAQVESDDDSESEEESKPVVSKQPAKKVAQVESDDDSEEETKPVAVTKQPVKKVAQVESDDDDDSEDDKPAPPAKKPVGKTTGGRGGKAKSANA
jgi:hypothetical protein